MSTATELDSTTESKVSHQPVRKWKVIFLNDDYTPMDFVVAVLMRYFRKSMDEAHQIALDVHKNGKGIAGVYTQEIAEHKSNETNMVSRANGHPLTSVAEPQ